MKITFKTIKGATFEIEAPLTTTVTELKARVEELQGAAFPSGSQTLIYKGKILKDDTTVGDNNIEETGFLVVMCQPKRPSSATPAPAAAPRSVEGETSAAAPASTTPAAVPAADAVPAPAPAAAPAVVPAADPAAAAPAAAVPAVADPTPTAEGADLGVYSTAASSLLSGGQLEEAVNSICEMGFPREDVARAMRAAFNNPERAVEYLMNGIPAAAEPQPAAAAAQVGAAAGQPAAVNVAQPPAGPTSQPFDMFGGGAVAPAAPAAGAAAAAAGAAAAQQTAAGNLAFLTQHPRFAQMRRAVQANPQILVPYLQEMGKSNPELLALINSNQQEFLRLIMEQPVDDAGDQLGGEMVATVTLTADDEAAIERLEGLGFPRDACIEAYLACDKDENLAANLLLENGMEMYIHQPGFTQTSMLTVADRPGYDPPWEPTAAVKRLRRIQLSDPPAGISS